MFDIGFWEVVIILVMALLILGPERLPRAARVIGLWVGRIRGSYYSMRDEVERELRMDEMRAAGRRFEDDIKDSVGEANRYAEVVRKDAEGAASEAQPRSDANSDAEQKPADGERRE